MPPGPPGVLRESSRRALAEEFHLKKSPISVIMCVLIRTIKMKQKIVIHF